MADLTVKYLGLQLKNPLVLGASNLVNDLDNLKQAEDAGIAAIVFKSLFEEQIQLESAQLDDQLEEYNERHAEMVSLFPSIQHAGPAEHLEKLRLAKENLNIPLIASLNCMYDVSWVEYAQQLEETGVDALELNFYAVPRKMDQTGSKIEDAQLEAFKSVKAKVKIPVSVKLSPFYANPLNLVKKLDEAGADGVILFNRLFQPEIDIDSESHYSPFHLSTKEDNKLPLRFAGLLYGNVNTSIISNTGIMDSDDAIKMLLAGADSVQIVSTVYKNKFAHITKMVSEIDQWMDTKGYKSIKDFKGKLSNQSINDPFVYKRAQYIDLLLKSENVLKKYSMR
ncbi:MAG: dihydroorotate dehydrogenase-like protein [Bacteroidetes bacterium]|jgi:dihydroorotate dehydrogenase (fumarate)|nr:dihydroorotate dehydrogenase-like protein [Bacteroidota bacterium]